jgi:hypothetical protein
MTAAAVIRIDGNVWCCTHVLRRVRSVVRLTVFQIDSVGSVPQNQTVGASCAGSSTFSNVTTDEQPAPNGAPPGFLDQRSATGPWFPTIGGPVPAAAPTLSGRLVIDR